jgi:hypothetical protein
VNNLLPDWAAVQIVNHAGRLFNDGEGGQIAANITGDARSVFYELRDVISAVVEEYRRPSIMLKPALSIDGNQWCALFGENLQDGVAGFGDSPELAYWDFDKNWCAKLAAPVATTTEKESKP